MFVGGYINIYIYIVWLTKRRCTMVFFLTRPNSHANTMVFFSDFFFFYKTKSDIYAL